ncbi:MAG: aromatic hydrocarbon degradation protein [Rhodomicrobium sp.]|nr:MAG: aromatic hydrocarbon degradation protein [Rhodomicrobium sp.]
MRQNSKKLAFGASALLLAGAVTSTALSTTALSGGFAVREQSTSGLGAAFAGNAAGYDLSTIFWNPAGVAIAGPGVTTESHAALIIPDSELTSLAPFADGANDIGKIALVPGSYAAYRINDKWTIGYGFNAPFGLGTEADDKNWGGQLEFLKSELTTYNFNPVVGYQVSPTLSIGLGLQVQYTDLRLSQSLVPPPTPSNTATGVLKGDDWSFGYTAGLLWQPAEGTSIGIGYRSMLEVELEGGLSLPGNTLPISGDLDQPEIATVSLRQSINDRTRFLATFEWTNWSRLDRVPIVGSGGLEIIANWDDGYFLSGGLEYDYSDKLTVRGGVAYEWSPVQEAEQRLAYVPDSDRVWLSVGATYKWNEQTSIDLAYTHIFVEDGDINLQDGASPYVGEAESSVDIIGVSMKTKWGADGPFGLLSGFNN